MFYACRLVEAGGFKRAWLLRALSVPGFLPNVFCLLMGGFSGECLQDRLLRGCRGDAISGGADHPRLAGEAWP